MAKLKFCKACGRKVNPKWHTCPPGEVIGIAVPGFFPLVFTEEQFEELVAMRKGKPEKEEAP